MSWRFGPFAVADDDIADIDTVNECFLAVTDTLSSDLNEHNFARSGFSDRSKWAEGISVTFNHVKASFASSANSTTCDITSSWHPFDDSFTETFTTTFRKVWVLASFQVKIEADYGILMALELDGSTLGESLLGSGDIDNDYFQDPSGAFGSVPTIWLPNGGPVVLEAVIEVTPGQHTIKPVFSMPRHASGDAVTLGDYELIVVGVHDA